MKKLMTNQFKDKDAAQVYARKAGFKNFLIVPVWVQYFGGLEYFENVSYNDEKGYPQVLRYEIQA